MFSRLKRTEPDPLWSREMRERWRRPVTLLFLAAYALGLCWLGFLQYSWIVPSTGLQLGAQTNGIGHRIFTFLLSAQIGAWIPLALLLSTPSIAAERERGSFTEYVLAGLLARQIWSSKFAAIATFIVVMCAIPLPILALCFPLGGVEPLELACGAVFEIMTALACASIGMVISVSNARTVPAVKQGMGVAFLLCVLEVIVVPPLLESAYWNWLGAIVLLMLVTYLAAKISYDSLDHLTHHLDEDETITLLPAAQPLSATPPTRRRARNVQATAPSPRSRTNLGEPRQATSLDVWVEHFARWNAVTVRDVRIGLRTSYARLTLAPGTTVERFLLRMVFSLGMASSGLLVLLGFDVWWNLNMHAALVGAMVGATVSCNGAFTRERDQMMMPQLQLSSMQPLEVVVGKVSATLLLMARSWGLLLIALFGIGLMRGPSVAVGSTLFLVMSIVTTVLLATLLSLVCRHNSVVTAGTLGTLLFLFLLVPLAPNGLAYFVPILRSVFNFTPFTLAWLRPISVVLFGVDDALRFGISLATAFVSASGSLVVLCALLLAIATLAWKRTRTDNADNGVRFWERDLSRSWR